MIPDKGDRSINVTVAAVCAGFQSVGASAGDTVIYHGSLSSMGMVEGGADAVIEGVRQAVGPQGTVAMPTLWYHGAEPPLDPADWDIDNSPSYVGRLSEVFRTHPESVRSDHFSHSVSAIGARAQELVADHGAGGLHPTPWCPGAFADVSPWQRLYDWNALYCFIGVTFRVLTMKHYMEARIVEEALQGLAPEAREAFTAELSFIGRDGVWAFFNSETLEERLAELGLVRYGKIGSATLRAIPTRELVDTAMPMLRDRAGGWFGEAFLDWWDRAKAEERPDV
ncbi:MAG: AAC(3) family N-acetyltransferase [Lentisphaeria bacterium]|nr:AAC(3) family N-acetyltransferase [Lentisphaeria bacterium]